MTVTAEVTAHKSCVFDPVTPSAFECPSSFVVTGQFGLQVYPPPGAHESCTDIESGTLGAGDTRTATMSWDQLVESASGYGQAPPGSYTAECTWSWSAGQGTAFDQETVSSAPFSIGV